MRAIWRGTLAFGPVRFPVALFSATEDKDVRFYQVHRDDGGRIRHRRTCEICGAEITYSDVVKGYDLGAGDLVLLESEDLEDLPLPTSRSAEVMEFVPARQIDPILYDRAYYVEPDHTAVRPYAVFREALRVSGKVAIVKIALRQREHLAAVRVRGDAMVLHTLLWPDELRTPESPLITGDVSTPGREVGLAGELIELMSADFAPEDYSDDYRQALDEVVAAKIAGREVVSPWKAEKVPVDGVDLMTSLEDSVHRLRDQSTRDGVR